MYQRRRKKKQEKIQVKQCDRKFPKDEWFFCMRVKKTTNKKIFTIKIRQWYIGCLVNVSELKKLTMNIEGGKVTHYECQYISRKS